MLNRPVSAFVPEKKKEKRKKKDIEKGEKYPVSVKRRNSSRPKFCVVLAVTPHWGGECRTSPLASEGISTQERNRGTSKPHGPCFSPSSVSFHRVAMPRSQLDGMLSVVFCVFGGNAAGRSVQN
jgi:hypothetical protein